MSGPCGFEFPRDHGPHPGYRVEWWYLTGHLETEGGGRRFGFQLTFFRNQLTPPGARDQWPTPGSAWRTENLFIAHAALTDIDRKRFHQSEAIAREALGLAGVRRDGEVTEVFLKDWSLRLTPESHRLRADARDFALQLALTPVKPPVPHGRDGYSLKGSTPERASCYYSVPRLEVAGEVTVEGATVPVRGQAWMDHEYSSAPLEPSLSGWDWFSLQLSDQTEVMVYLLRQQDGTPSPASSGTLVTPSGGRIHLAARDITVTVLDHWQSPRTGARYPARWRLQTSAPTSLDLTITPHLAAQEMLTSATTTVNYWEGSVSAAGTAAGKPVSGVGYVELTGYDRPFSTPR